MNPKEPLGDSSESSPSSGVADPPGSALEAIPVLNSIALACANNGEPDLSAVVVNGDTGVPGAVGGQAYDPDNPAHALAWERN